MRDPLAEPTGRSWRHRLESNQGVRNLQSLALPLGYGAEKVESGPRLFAQIGPSAPRTRNAAMRSPVTCFASRMGMCAARRGKSFLSEARRSPRSREHRREGLKTSVSMMEQSTLGRLNARDHGRCNPVPCRTTRPIRKKAGNLARGAGGSCLFPRPSSRGSRSRAPRPAHRGEHPDQPLPRRRDCDSRHRISGHRARAPCYLRTFGGRRMAQPPVPRSRPSSAGHAGAAPACRGTRGSASNGCGGTPRRTLYQTSAAVAFAARRG